MFNIEPAYKDHLCTRTTFGWSLWWSLYTSLAVLYKQRIWALIPLLIHMINALKHTSRVDKTWSTGSASPVYHMPCICHSSAPNSYGDRLKSNVCHFSPSHLFQTPTFCTLSRATGMSSFVSRSLDMKASVKVQSFRSSSSLLSVFTTQNWELGNWKQTVTNINTLPRQSHLLWQSSGIIKVFWCSTGYNLPLLKWKQSASPEDFDHTTGAMGEHTHSDFSTKLNWVNVNKNLCKMIIHSSRDWYQ